jgi:hypothetical protein
VSNKRRIYENYAGIFPTFDVFCSVLDQCTTNNECLVIRKNAKSNKLEDMVFWYKAETPEAFRLGDREFWKIQEELDEESSDEEEMYDVNAINSTKKGPSIHVKKKKAVRR